MAVATYPVSQVVETGPRNRAAQYIIQSPAGAGVTDHAFLGPIDAEPGMESFGLHVSGAPSTADLFRLTVLGTFDGPSITPSARNWMNMRGDIPPSTATGAGAGLGLNQLLLAVTYGGHITVRGPARSYRFRVSGGATGNTNAITLTALCIRPNW